MARRRKMFHITHRQAGMIVDAFHGRDRFGRKLKSKPITKADGDISILSLLVILGVFFHFALGMPWFFLIAGLGVLVIFETSKSVKTKFKQKNIQKKEVDVQFKNQQKAEAIQLNHEEDDAFILNRADESKKIKTTK